ncbi:nucleotide sugar dehydrogenase [Gilvimarinus sp. DA14]|uniref:nucleotide sugar dehydrogenase n=1 Tax=Gilvimarinus sp. DA14 TaxID=2956798 RepID=UPI0020B8D228|nr:UDP-glucose/GDP-mannose dehydrogenase family protein [Gilvimarinus sp. DA14]UTF59850.1 UDP-glucose/GDP-mannose dehydrogenase family protein [Gilvimarinus sp. DA14]
MKISVLGLGYVGAVCTACLANRGHQVIGGDVSRVKVDLINAGKSPIVEPGLEDLIAEGVAKGVILATTNTERAVLETDLSMICVGTPSKKNGDLDLTYVRAVCQDVGKALKQKNTRHTIVIRSTVLPGTVRSVIIPVLEEASGLKAGTDFGLAMNPEFLRESTAIEDYDKPPMTVIGELDKESGDPLEEIYKVLDAPIVRKPIEVAEMIKYTCNVWHATKVAFANEIGNISKAVGIDGREVMDIICQDTTLNISKTYMRPGFAFGGSCLPKDVKALNYRARQLDLNQPLLSSLMSSNTQQIEYAFDRITGYGKRKISILGLSFKAGTDDLRESPLVELAEKLIGKGYELKIYDQNVKYASIHGSNREYIEARIPHLSSLLHDSREDVIDHGEVIILGNGEPAFGELIDSPVDDKRVFDLVGFMKTGSNGALEGVCW